MFTAARLRLTGWYVLILAAIVGILSVAIYRLLLIAQHSELGAVRPGTRHLLEQVFAHDEVTLAYWIAAVDLGVLILSAIGAYLLAGRTLRPIHDMLEQRRRFSSAASHELRTPLTALQGTIEVALLRPRTGEEYERVLREALDETQRMGHLVRDLMAVARAEEGSAFHFAPADLRDLASRAVEDVQSLAERKAQTLDLDLDGSLPVQADAVKLRQALVNLVDNAVTYTPHGGMIRVIARAERGHGVVEVRDTGPGIDPQDLPHLFEPFYQADTARSGKDHVGLGLSLADWIVREHKGSIRVESQPGVGTAFRVTLPLTS